MSRRSLIGIGIVIGGLLTVSLFLWGEQQSPTSQVRRTVLTTMQEEAPASFLVTGTLEMNVTVRIDSSQYVTPDWLTYALTQGGAGMQALLKGGAQTEVRVPGRVSYGFDVRALRPDMVRVEEGDTIELALPALAIHSIEPDLSQIQVQTTTEGWMQVFSSGVPAAVRKRALSEVRETFRAQAQERIDTAPQPRVNTAQALERMLTSPLVAAGIDDPTFRIQIGERLLRRPEATEEETFRND